MSAPLLEGVGWALVHSLWQFAVLGLGLRIALRAARGAPSTHRYALACATLLAMLATAVATGVRAAASVSAEPHPTAAAASSADPHPASPATVGDADGDPAPRLDDIAPRGFAAGGASAVVERMRAALDPRLGWIVAAWLAGVALLSLRLTGAWLVVRRLGRAGTHTPPRALADAAKRLSAALGVRRAVSILTSTAVQVPTVIGWLRPVILVPVSALTGLTPRQVELLILHELAHIRRHDYLVNLLQAACETLLFHHPAVWYVGRQIRAEREHCCDELAAGLSSVREYAGALATLEELRHPPALAVAANGGSLLARVRRLVHPPVRSTPPRVGAALLAVALAAVAAVPALGRVAREDALPPAASTAVAPSLVAPVPCAGTAAAGGSTLCPDLERALGALLAGYAPGSSAIVQDVRSGAVLAYAATGDGTRGLTEPAMPASVWKLVVSALWWEQGMGDAPLPCPARLEVDGRTVRNMGGMQERMTPHDMLVHSCNTAAAGMAVRLRDAVGADAVRDGVRRLGFGPGEEDEGRDTAFWATRSAGFRARMSPARGRMALDAWDGFAIGMLGVETTPLHVARFLQAIGNGGMMVAPTVEAALADRPDARRVMSAATALRLREAMLDAVRRGTARAAAEALGGSTWRLGGKTGTAPGDGDEEDGWFAGLAFDGAGEARYVVVVRIPDGGPGGGASARLAGRITRLL